MEQYDIRLLDGEGLAEGVKLADATFRDEQQFSMELAFRDMFDPALGQSYGAYEDGKLVSFMGLVPSTVNVGPSELAVYSVGAVCTDPAYRGKGHAGRLLETVFRHADEAGAALVLVSGDRTLYTRADCCNFGRMEMVTLDPASAEAVGKAAHNNSLSIRESRPTDLHVLRSLAAARPVRFEQSVSDLARLIAAEAHVSCSKLSHRVLIAERSGRPAAFLVVGVPYPIAPDKTPMAVEWAGEPQAVAAMATFALKHFSLSKLRLHIPWFERDLLGCFASVSERKQLGNLGTVWVVRPERVIDALRPYWALLDSDAAATLAASKLPDGKTRVTVRGKSADLSATEFVSLLFTPGSLPEALGGDDSVSRLFPIPFPWAGGLNFV